MSLCVFGWGGGGEGEVGSENCLTFSSKISLLRHNN